MKLECCKQLSGKYKTPEEVMAVFNVIFPADKGRLVVHPDLLPTISMTTEAKSEERQQGDKSTEPQEKAPEKRPGWAFRLRS
jgi:hypothetical protein